MFGLNIRRALLTTAAAFLCMPGVAHADVDNTNADMSETPTPICPRHQRVAGNSTLIFLRLMRP